MFYNSDRREGSFVHPVHKLRCSAYDTAAGDPVGNGCRKLISLRGLNLCHFNVRLIDQFRILDIRVSVIRLHEIVRVGSSLRIFEFLKINCCLCVLDRLDLASAGILQIEGVFLRIRRSRVIYKLERLEKHGHA